MSDYSDCFYDARKEQIKRENDAAKFRSRLVNELSTDDMIKIMFKEFIKNQSDGAVVSLGNSYLDLD